MSILGNIVAEMEASIVERVNLIKSTNPGRVPRLERLFDALEAKEEERKLFRYAFILKTSTHLPELVPNLAKLYR